jgi:hypothetical protein
VRHDPLIDVIERSNAMIDNGQFEVRKPLLWFRAIGQTIPDGLPDLEERVSTVYASALAKPGEHFYLVDGVLVQQGRDGTLAAGALTLRGTPQDNVREAFLMTLAEELSLISLLNTPPCLPTTPSERYSDLHCGVVRIEVSPEFAKMMDATVAFRHECDADGGWAVNCRDFGTDRKIALSVVDIETQLWLVQIEVDSHTQMASISVADREFNATLIAALRNAGMSISDMGIAEGQSWDGEMWSLAQSILSDLFFKRVSTPAIAMAV